MSEYLWIPPFSTIMERCLVEHWMEILAEVCFKKLFVGSNILIETTKIDHKVRKDPRESFREQDHEKFCNHCVIPLFIHFKLITPSKTWLSTILMSFENLREANRLVGSSILFLESGSRNLCVFICDKRQKRRPATI